MLGAIKGAPLKALLEEWSVRHGRAALSTAVHALSPSDRRELLSGWTPKSHGVLASSWYPSQAAGRLVAELVESLPPAQRERELELLAEGVMRRTLNTVHRAVFRLVGSPDLMRKRGTLFWRQQYDSGKVTITDDGPGAQTHIYSSWPGHHRMLCRMSFLCVPPMFRAMGVQQPRVSFLRCVDDPGQHDCAAEIRWTP